MILLEKLWAHRRAKTLVRWLHIRTKTTASVAHPSGSWKHFLRGFLWTHQSPQSNGEKSRMVPWQVTAKS
jgi:hypothetical protein